MLSKFQMVKRPKDNTVAFTMIVGKYRKFKKGRIHWKFIDFEKAFDCINRDLVA